MRHLAWPARKMGGAALELESVETPAKPVKAASLACTVPYAAKRCLTGEGEEFGERKRNQIFKEWKCK